MTFYSFQFTCFNTAYADMQKPPEHPQSIQEKNHIHCIVMTILACEIKCVLTNSEHKLEMRGKA